MEKIIKNITDDDIINGSFVISKSVQKIGKLAFAFCSTLESIVIPDSVIEIGQSAFMDCISLESIIIPDRVKKIENYTFFNCKSLKKISLPKDIIFGDYVFYKCPPDLEIEYR